MKVTAKTLPTLVRLLLLCMVIGTLAWELLALLVAGLGPEIRLAVGPIGFDIRVLSVQVMANPGTFLGILPAIFLFARTT